MNQEKEVSSISGYVMIGVALLVVAAAVALSIYTPHLFLISLAIITIAFFIRGFFMVYPNESRVLVLFGDYVGTVKKNVFSGPIHFIRARKFHCVPVILTVSGSK